MFLWIHNPNLKTSVLIEAIINPTFHIRGSKCVEESTSRSVDHHPNTCWLSDGISVATHTTGTQSIGIARGAYIYILWIYSRLQCIERYYTEQAVMFRSIPDLCRAMQFLNTTTSGKLVMPIIIELLEMVQSTYNSWYMLTAVLGCTLVYVQQCRVVAKM